MNEILLWSTLVVPLVLAPCQGVTSGVRTVGRLTAWAPLPALALAVMGGTFTVEVPWLLLGARLGVDTVGRVFLGLTAGLWLAAGLYARSYLADDCNPRRFQVFFLVTMAGNLGVTVARDVASFLTCFALMSLAAYGLITHDRRPASMRAGRVYLVMTIAGEMLLFAGLILLARETQSLDFEGFAARLAESPYRSPIAGLLLAGFGIKLGVMPLHIWLPLAHPAAPTPASAVLSGAMIKTGLLGLLRVLPLGTAELQGWGNVCLLAGITTSLLAALIGIAQSNPKTVLAYSSISQMGLVAMGLGAALAAPEAWPLIAPALLLWAVHHAMAKGALFLGVGVAKAKMPDAWSAHLVAAGLLLAALTLAGLPLTTGFAAKAALKAATSAADTWGVQWAGLLPLTSVTTTLLMSRFLWLVWPSRQHGHGPLTWEMVVPWAALSAGTVVGFAALRGSGLVDAAWLQLDPDAVWGAIWPMGVAGVVLLLVLGSPGSRSALGRIQVPEGDIAIPVAAITRGGRGIGNQVVVDQLPRWYAAVRHTVVRRVVPGLARLLDGLTRGLENDTAAGLLIAVLVVVLFVLSQW